MSNKPMAQPKSIAESSVARKRYAAPLLEAYGTVQELTLTSAPAYYSGSDISTYYTSVPV